MKRLITILFLISSIAVFGQEGGFSGFKGKIAGYTATKNALVIIDTDGNILPFKNGSNGQYLVMVNGVPTWASPFGTTQSLTGDSPTWNVNSGIDATYTLVNGGTITLSNLVSGMSGTLYVTNSTTSQTMPYLEFAGYTFKITKNIRRDSNTVIVSSGNTGKKDVFTWKYNGSYVIINGTLDPY